MRVVAGIARGRKLFAPKNLDIRPTSDKVRESLFNILGGHIEGSSFIDICSGTGAIGIEALSRGAKEVFFVDSNRTSLALTRKNVEVCSFDKSSSNYSFLDTSGEGAIDRLSTKKACFDFVFLDPPYHGEVLDNLLAKISAAKEFLRPDGVLIVEHFSKKILPEKVGALQIYRSKRYGDTSLSFYSLQEEP